MSKTLTEAHDYSCAGEMIILMGDLSEIKKLGGINSTFQNLKKHMDFIRHRTNFCEN